MNVFSSRPLLVGRWSVRRAFARQPILGSVASTAPEPWPGLLSLSHVPTPRGRLLHGRHFTYKSITGDMAITFVSTGVEGAFATEEHPYAAHGPWLQVRRLLFFSLPPFRAHPLSVLPWQLLAAPLPEGLVVRCHVECGCYCLAHQLQKHFLASPPYPEAGAITLQALTVDNSVCHGSSGLRDVRLSAHWVNQGTGSGRVKQDGRKCGSHSRAIWKAHRNS